MKIPIENVYYLLCYAWDKLAEKDVVAVDTVGVTNLLDLFAGVLINGTNHLLKRGFDRGYVVEHEWTSRLRGRICFQEAIQKNATNTTKLPCMYDDLSYDVLHNQILKTTLGRLMRTEELDDGLTECLGRLRCRFSEIQDIELTSRVFGKVQLHRNNQIYDFLLKVCELIYHNLLVSEQPGASKFRDFVRDRRQMAVLFEEFVRNFYQKHTHYKVGRENIKWKWTAVDDNSSRLLPRMQTDISLNSNERKIIIDCKFTPEATQHHYEAEKLRSSHLYQISAYLNNLSDEQIRPTCEIMLLYPTMDAPFSACFLDKGRRISIRTINLNQPWQLIHRDLLSLIK